MGRRLEFDYERAVGAATRLFWSRGYRSTSLRDLLRVMKIGESSFYNSLKDKETLYLECLKHYNRTVTARRLQALNAGHSVRLGFRKFFQMALDDIASRSTPNGCLMTHSLAPEVLERPKVRKYVQSEMNAFEQHLAQRIEDGQASGELDPSLDSHSLARNLIVYLQGLFSVTGIFRSAAEMKIQTEDFLTSLGL